MPSNDSGTVTVMKWSTQSAISTCLAKHMGVLDQRATITLGVYLIQPDLQFLRALVVS